MCFELLGFDIMLDSECQPSLLEVNLSPSFMTDSPLDDEIKSKLMRDLFKLLGMSVQNKKELQRKNAE
jgi:tubulin polyglutamylase TTLL6/13